MAIAELISLDSKVSPVDLQIVEPLAGERALRGLKPFGILFLAGSIFLLVQIIHFVVPWVLYLVAIVIGVKTFLEPKLIRSGQGPCPVCEKPVIFKNAPFHSKSKLVCESCRNQLRLIIRG